MTGRARTPPAEAVPISAIVEQAPSAGGARLREFTVAGVRVQVLALKSECDADAAALTQKLRAICSIQLASPRLKAWGPGQHDRTRLGPGIEAWIRVTPVGEVRMVAPGGDLNVTEGAVSLGLGLHAASAHAAQVRVRREERKRRRRERGDGGRVGVRRRSSR